MADTEDIQPLVCDNGTGMVKVKKITRMILLFPNFACRSDLDSMFFFAWRTLTHACEGYLLI